MTHTIAAPAPRTVSFNIVATATHFLNGFDTARQRRQLAKLSADQLNDIGITSTQATNEAARASFFTG